MDLCIWQESATAVLRANQKHPWSAAPNLTRALTPGRLAQFHLLVAMLKRQTATLNVIGRESGKAHEENTGGVPQVHPGPEPHRYVGKVRTHV